MEQRLALVIEDDDAVAELLGEALRQGGFTVELLKNGQTAQARLEQVTPAVVILDLHLPYVSGEALLRHIRAEPRLAGTRVIITTGEARRAEAMRALADLVLLKPVGYGEVADLAARLLPGDDPAHPTS